VKMTLSHEPITNRGQKIAAGRSPVPLHAEPPRTVAKSVMPSRSEPRLCSIAARGERAPRKLLRSQQMQTPPENRLAIPIGNGAPSGSRG